MFTRRHQMTDEAAARKKMERSISGRWKEGGPSSVCKRAGELWDKTVPRPSQYYSVLLSLDLNFSRFASFSFRSRPPVPARAISVDLRCSGS